MKTATFHSLELRVFDLGDDGHLCRIGVPFDQPDRVVDSFYPAHDLGYLWFRWVDGHLACSGMVSDVALGEHAIDELVAFVDATFLGTDHHVDYCIDVVRRVLTRAESGEESLRY